MPKEMSGGPISCASLAMEENFLQKVSLFDLLHVLWFGHKNKIFFFHVFDYRF
jgi:hypothetical protein